MFSRIRILLALAVLCTSALAHPLVDAARSQIGVTTRYDGS